MKGINKVILVGRLGKDPEIRYTQSGKQVANVSIATDVKYKDNRTGETQTKTSWHNCTGFGKVAELVDAYCKKGQKIYVEGSLDYQNYEKNGQKVYITKITIKEFILLSGNEGDSQKRESNGIDNNNNGDNYNSTTEIDQDIPF